VVEARVYARMEVEAVKRAFLRSGSTSSSVCLREKLPPHPPQQQRGKRSRAAAAAAAAAVAGSSLCVGVFAARRIRVDEDLGEYSGEHIRLSDSTKLSEFAFELNDKLAIEPAAQHSLNQQLRLSQVCVAHFVDQPQPHQRCTARFLLDLETFRVTLRAIVELEEGDEVLVSYGNCRPTAEPRAVNEAQCVRFAPLVKLKKAEQQRLALVSEFTAAARESGAEHITAAVQVRVVERLAPVVRRRLVKPAATSRPRTVDRWTPDETEELVDFIKRFGPGQWDKKAEALSTSPPGVTRTAAAAAFIWHAKLKMQEVRSSVRLSAYQQVNAIPPPAAHPC
jgi:hypothetical protein